MSTLVLQIIIKQWDKSQRTEKYIEERAQIPSQYPIEFPTAFYAFNNQCIIDQHGDDLLGDRLAYSQSNNGMIQIDRFQINLSTMMLEYRGAPDSNSVPRIIGSLDNTWIQCQYDWRYSVFEGGFYYWLYEDVSLNAIYVDTLDENIFINSELALSNRIRLV